MSIQDNDLGRYMNRKTLAGIGILVVLYCLQDCFFSIQPTDRGNVRRFGVVQYEKPLQPGLHFKLPYIDSVDRIQVSLVTMHIPPFDVTTVDNQKVTLDLNFNYTIPEDKVYHLMYEIGRPGNNEIETQIMPVVRDRASRIFASQNMVVVNANRSEIQTQIEQSISKSVEALFGIEPHSLQIAGIKPSAENTKRTRQFEADQQVIKAKGEADSAVEAAKGRAEAVRLEAEANKTKLELEGAGQESRLSAEIKPFGTPERYIQYMSAKAALNWNGQQPQVVAGNGGSTNLLVPIPMSGGK